VQTEAERRVRTRLGELRVRVVDPPGGAGERTAVLWPSMFVDSTTFDGMLPLLPPTHRLVLVDGPGLGGSEPLRRRSSVTEAALAAVDLLEGLGVTEPVDWVGNALGGHVGYELGLLSSAPGGGPLRSLVAVSAPLEPVPPLLRVKINVLRPLLAARGPVGPVRSAVVDALLTDASAADPDVLAVLDASLRRPTPASLSTALASFVLARVDVRGHLPRLHLPCLFVASDDRGDWSPEAARSAASAAPDARAAVVRGARTVVPLEQPAALADLVGAFWAELEG
jgi:pimeloyl-ACP methyl ester carboxylesterase